MAINEEMINIQAGAEQRKAKILEHAEENLYKFSVCVDVEDIDINDIRIAQNFIKASLAEYHAINAQIK